MSGRALGRASYPRLLPWFYRLLLCATVVPAVAAPASANEPRVLPYEAVITDNGVLIRSGPGQQYYPTDRLMQGDTVMVYRHDEGGWLAIRPPAGSHCWVRSDFVSPSEREDVAEVRSAEAFAYVGSSLGDSRNVVQVRLDPGEPVQILGMQNVPDEEAGEPALWYKIAPPAGEFRWISNRHVRPVGENVAARGKDRTQSPAGTDAASEASSRDGIVTRPIPKPGAADPLSPAGSERFGAAPAQHLLELAPPRNGYSEARPAPRGAPPRELRNDGGPPISLAPLTDNRTNVESIWKPRAPGASRVRELIAAKGGPTNISNQVWATAAIPSRPIPTVEGGSPTAGTAAGTGQNSSPPATTVVPNQFSGPLTPVMPIGFGAAPYTGPLPTRDELELALTKMVTLDPAAWRLPELRAQAVALYQSAQSAIDRNHAEKLVQRIDQFLSLQNNRRNLTTGGVPVDPFAAARTAAGQGTPAPLNPPAASAYNPAAVYPGRATGNNAAAANRGTVQQTRSASPNPLKQFTEKLLSPFGPLPGFGGDDAASGEASGTGPGAPAAHFDAVGWLMPVVYRDPQQQQQNHSLPAHAVTDEHGNVLALVRPTPGVNLRRYERQRVGVRGSTTQVVTRPNAPGGPGQTKPLVSAVRVVSLDTMQR
jgi:hypothetical protein